MPETSDEELFERIRTAEDRAMNGFHESLEALDGKRCTFCFKSFTPAELDDPDATYIEVRSWVTGPKLQSPVLRDHSGRRAHTACVKKQIDGEAADQEPLPEFDA